MKTFKLFLEETRNIVGLISRLDPESLYGEKSLFSTTFFYLARKDILLCGDGNDTHINILNNEGFEVPRYSNNMDKIQVRGSPETATEFTVGRFALVTGNESLSDPILNQIATDHPGTGFVLMWQSWLRSKLTTELLNRTVSKLLNIKRNEIIGHSPADTPIKPSYYVNSGIIPTYRIDGKAEGSHINDEEKDIRKMAGELHYLPSGSPRLIDIIHKAKEISRSPHHKEYEWFVNRVRENPKTRISFSNLH